VLSLTQSFSSSSSSSKWLLWETQLLGGELYLPWLTDKAFEVGPRLQWERRSERPLNVTTVFYNDSMEDSPLLMCWYS
jgi:hypothetical protein